MYIYICIYMYVYIYIYVCVVCFFKRHVLAPMFDARAAVKSAKKQNRSSLKPFVNSKTFVADHGISPKAVTVS